MKKFLIALILVIVLGGSFYVYKKNISPAKQMDLYYQEKPEFKPTVIPTESASAPNMVNPTIINQDGLDSVPKNIGNQVELGEESAQVYEVSYNGQVFVPEVQKIKINDYIFFINNSEGDFWPYSEDVDHTILNSQKNILPTKQYKFQFKQAGKWAVKDKFNNQALVKIIVE